jgi:predicted phosphoribosyltransferase
MLFRNRADAGRVLSGKLRAYAGRPDTLVLALPRGGVPVAFEVARALGAPLDVFLVRKLGLPGQEELAMGAIASGGVRILNPDVMERMDVAPEIIDRVTAIEKEELQRREREYRGDRAPLNVQGRTVILVDDGLATGSSMRAAVAALGRMRPRAVVIAVPVAARETCEALRDEADDIVCARTPEPFRAVGLWYQDFSQTSDDEVRDLLRQAAAPDNETRRPPDRPAEPRSDRPVRE